MTLIAANNEAYRRWLFMGRQRHKRKNSHVVIVTSDSVNAGTRQFRIRNWATDAIVLLLSIAVGVVIGVFSFRKDVSVPDETKEVQNEDYQEKLTALELENGELKTKVKDLSDSVNLLSDTVNQEAYKAEQLQAKLDEEFLPTEFPLTRSAAFEEAPEGDPMCIFSASSGAMVVATAKGTVTAVNDDAEYGHNVWVDHGNGYITIYRNKGEVMVKQGETVQQGSTLFIINDENGRLCYQMMKDWVYIDPMELLEIRG